MATEAGTKLHIHHLSTAVGLRRVMDLRTQGHRVTVEALIAHLFLDEHAYDTYGNLVKLNPPIRPAADVDALWKGNRPPRRRHHRHRPRPAHRM